MFSSWGKKSLAHEAPSEEGSETTSSGGTPLKHMLELTTKRKAESSLKFTLNIAEGDQTLSNGALKPADLLCRILL